MLISWMLSLGMYQTPAVLCSQYNDKLHADIPFEYVRVHAIGSLMGKKPPNNLDIFASSRNHTTVSETV